MHSIWSRQTCPKAEYHVGHDDITGCCSVESSGTIRSCPNATSSSSIPARGTISGSSKQLLPTVAVVQTSLSHLRGTKAALSLPSTLPGHTLELFVSKTKSVRNVSVTADETLTCPASNATLYTDSNRNTYEIHCSQDNSYTSYDTVTIAAGGFSACFASCDNLTACAGFTYVGLDGGRCYLKQAMPEDLSVATAGSNYVSCSRVNSSAPQSTSSGSPAHSATASSMPTNHRGPGNGAIAGIVVGSVIGVSLDFHQDWHI
ncbi:hypothetical protein BDV97DRAFT_224746 [Delphinella strobiligena]|nr:hypothetical protein BDV97DRAFT_224746 [Delphinella strobiligena]